MPSPTEEQRPPKERGKPRESRPPDTAPGELRVIPPLDAAKPRQPDNPSTGRRGGRDVAARRARAATIPTASGRLGVRPARLVPLEDEGRALALAALTVLYRDFLQAGELDIARASRCPRRPANDRQLRRAA